MGRKKGVVRAESTGRTNRGGNTEVSGKEPACLAKESDGVSERNQKLEPQRSRRITENSKRVGTFCWGDKCFSRSPAVKRLFAVPEAEDYLSSLLRRSRRFRS